MIWSPEVRADVKRRFLDGDSAGVIAIHFGCARGAIAGGLRRMGLKRDGSAPKQARAYGADSHNRALKPKGDASPRGSPEHKRRQAKAATLRLALVAGGHPGDGFATVGRPFLSRKRDCQCAYLVAGERADSLACCAPGEAVTDGSAPYCPAHRAIMFTAPQTNTKDLERDVRRRFAA
jgi:hypothetical protein